MRRAERLKREAVERELRAEHEALRARLFVVVDRTEQYTDELLAEIQRWNDARKAGRQ